MNPPRTSLLPFALALTAMATSAWGGSLNKNYFAGTKPGAWSEYLLTSPDGSKSSYSYERQSDDDGHPVIEMQVKIIEGPGKDSKTRLKYFLPRDFNFERDGLNYGRLTEKMVMNCGGAEMAVDPKTLETIRQSEKDFRGAVTFEASEKIDGHVCDRYAYSIKISGPSPAQESGRLWLDPAVPFGIVRQVARVSNSDGKLTSEFEMRLQETGLNQALAVATPAPAEPKKMAMPSEVSMTEGFKAGRFGIELEVVQGSAGRRLRLTLQNKGEAPVTVTVPAGDMEIEAGSPINTLRVTNAKAVRLLLPAGGGAEPFIVDQRGSRGPVEGRCSLSVYEGTPLYSGSVTLGSLPK